MINKKIKIFCVTNKVLNYFEKLPYTFAGVGKKTFPKNYLLSNNLNNIYYKEKYYSELTFHYWFWKNMLKKIHKDTWVGFCQKRRFWLKKRNISNDYGSVIYLNSGDWIENLTALEYYNEEWHIYQHIDHDTDLEQESDDELNTKILFDNLLQELSLEAESI